jgi:hypothetical protein
MVQQPRKPRAWAELAGPAPEENAALPYADDEDAPRKQARRASTGVVDWAAVSKAKQEEEIAVLVPPIFNFGGGSAASSSRGVSEDGKGYDDGEVEKFGVYAAGAVVAKKKGGLKGAFGRMGKKSGSGDEGYGGEEEKPKKKFLGLPMRKRSSEGNDISDSVSVHSKASRKSFGIFRRRTSDGVEDDAKSLGASEGKTKKLVKFFSGKDAMDDGAMSDGEQPKKKVGFGRLFKKPEEDSAPAAPKGRRKSLFSKGPPDSDDEDAPRGTTVDGEYLFPGEVALMKSQQRSNTR